MQDNQDPFLNTRKTYSDFNNLGKILFSKELLMIAEKGTEISFLIFFWIDMGMLLGPVLLLELKACIKLDISSGVVGVMKNDSAFGFLRLPEKFLFVDGMCFWSSLLIDVNTFKCSAISFGRLTALLFMRRKFSSHALTFDLL